MILQVKTFRSGTPGGCIFKKKSSFCWLKTETTANFSFWKGVIELKLLTYSKNKIEC